MGFPKFKLIWSAGTLFAPTGGNSVSFLITPNSGIGPHGSYED